MGLTNSSTGLSYGVGLIFPIVPTNIPGTVGFGGAGSLSVLTRLVLSVSSSLAGAGGLSVQSSLTLTAGVTFNGASALSAD